MNNNGNDARFDATMRQRHAAAIAQPSARTRAQLQLRLRAVATGQPERATGLRKRHGWPLAAAFAAVLAIAVDLQLQLQSTQQSAPQPVAPPVADSAITDDDTFDTMLDESPDFYLWLASTDADSLAME